MPLLECIPNFSTGRDPHVLTAIQSAILSVPEVYLLHVDAGKGANRTVMTIAGKPESVVEAAFRAIKVATEKIDMRQHRGTHPRMGATDVCPLVPLEGASMTDAIRWARQLGERVATELDVPVYLYEQAAIRPERRNLATIRRGEYEGLAEKMTRSEWRPDYGPVTFQPHCGATVIGARSFLLAYNINLNTPDVMVAKAIAADIRESGQMVKGHAGKLVRQPGQFRGLKAIGWYIDEYERAQVSTNITDFRLAPLAEVFEAARLRAEWYGAKVTGSELIGLVPQAAIQAAGKFYCQQQDKGLEGRDCMDLAVRSLGLTDIAPFELEERVIEWCLKVQQQSNKGKEKGAEHLS